VFSHKQPARAALPYGSSVDSNPRAEMAALDRLSPEFQRVYDEHFALVWRGLARLGTPDANLEDAVQDVFLVVHRRYAEFAARSSFTTWIYGIAVKVAKDHRRAAARHQRRVREWQSAAAHDNAFADSPADVAQEREAARLVQSLLEELPEEHRELLVLVELEQLALSEAAQALGLGLRTAQRRLRQARALFDEHLGRVSAEAPLIPELATAPRATP
jgi:RNA polymerase sigma-70 factor, ECF subfamily